LFPSLSNILLTDDLVLYHYYGYNAKYGLMRSSSFNS